MLKSNDSPSEKSFSYLFSIIFFFLAGFFYNLNSSNHFGHLFFFIAVIIFFIGKFRPIWLGTLNAQWLRLGDLLNYIFSPIILGILYLLTIVPVSLILRLIGKRTLELQLNRNTNTYWIDRKASNLPSNMKNQF